MANKERKEVSPTRQNEEVQRRSGRSPFELDAGEFFSNPFSVMRRMHDEMDRVFSDVLGQQTGRAAMGGFGTWPAIDISERDNELSVCAELPGLKPEDVKVEVLENALVLEGERKQEHKEEEGGRFRSERRYGRFHRTIPLPEGAKTEDARADFKNGELRITIPVDRPQNTRRQIPIGGGKEST